MMFRKVKISLTQESNEKIELRHQRTCDVVFDLPVDPRGKVTGDIKNYVFKMIETLLPNGTEEANVQAGNLKMM